MNRLHRCLRAAQLLSLMVVLQVPFTFAYPYLPDSPPNADTTDPAMPTSSADHSLSSNKIYQIDDGQIQVAAVPAETQEGILVRSASPTFWDGDPPQITPGPWPGSWEHSSSLSARDWVTTKTIYVTVYSTVTATTTDVSLVPGPSTPAPAESSDSTLDDSPELLSTSVPDSALTTLTTSAVQTATESALQNTVGSVITSLEASGRPTSLPFPTEIANATSSLSLVDTATLGNVQPSDTSAVTTLSASDIFQAIATDSPAALIGSRADHPVPRLGIQPQQQKLQTNKFYNNFHLTSQNAPVFTFPYSVRWVKGLGDTGSWGLSVSHIEKNQLATGSARPGFDAGQWAFYANPLGIESVILSAVELGGLTTLTTDSLEAFSANVNLLSSPGASPTITFPLLQGAVFITGNYTDATPFIQSGVGFENVTYSGTIVGGATHKYAAVLANGYTWMIYVTPSDPAYSANSFTLVGQNVQGPSNFNGYIQVAKVPGGSAGDAVAIYDGSAGAYAVAASISGAVAGTSGSYTLSWTKQGVQAQSLLMFALPHHLTSLSYGFDRTDLQLMTTVKGVATAIRGDSWTLNEPNLPISMGFAPWSPTLGSVKAVTQEAAAAISAAGTAELAQNVSAQTNVGSLYYDGKALAKFAAMIYALYDMAENHTLALTGLQLLQQAFDLHVRNQMTWPLVYDEAWGGAVSSSSYVDGNSGDDFGNTYYNDHHFHYGYFVYTAAVIGYLDPTWLIGNNNVAWVNMLVRDYANPVSDDAFPFSRSFDWYHGHSWAGGLFESFDGKNQESSSEDTLASYALKMWGQVINDQNMEARGNLMLAVQARSLQSYYLYTSDNTVEPAEFIGNKAAGILFENKIDHTTYFGADPKYVEGIHMLPLMPFSTLMRTPQFVAEEWSSYGWPTNIDNVTGGWKGILLANYAIIDPTYSYQVFLNTTGAFNPSFLDGGASQTWYLAWSAALGGTASTN